MTNEATLIVDTGFPVSFTVADATGIEKGALLKLTDPRTASAATAGAACAGIAAVEKIANDGVTQLAVYRQGQFKLTISGSVTVGDSLVFSSGGTNLVESAAVNSENIVGTALETGSNAETILVELNPRSMNLA